MCNARLYQDVELDGKTIKGTSESHRTWERLNTAINFRGKSVIDCGCSAGYFCFKAEEAGACDVTGIDKRPKIIEVARNIATLKRSRARFIISDIREFEIPNTDIILALNMLHHLNYDVNAINSMFLQARLLVFEIFAKDLPRIDIIAQRCGSGKPALLNSHREDRCIAIYGFSAPVVIPKIFTYHRHRAMLWDAVERVMANIYYYLPSSIKGNHWIMTWRFLKRHLK